MYEVQPVCCHFILMNITASFFAWFQISRVQIVQIRTLIESSENMYLGFFYQINASKIKSELSYKLWFSGTTYESC